MMAIAAKFLPQLLTYEDEVAKSILRNLKKVKIKNEYQLVDLGVNEYVSIPKLDQKAFRYVEKNGKLYLRESVYSVGGLVQDSVLINLGEFTLGDDETGAGLEYLARVKDAKAKQRAQQLRECERIAFQTLNRINKQVKNDTILRQWQAELAADKMFVRLGKEDYYQSQVAIIAKFASADETLAKIIVDYDTKINDKNQKWLTQPLKMAKKPAAKERIGNVGYQGVGTINPARREEFNEFYAVRSPQMTPYLQDQTEVVAELPAAPEFIPVKEVPEPVVENETAQVVTQTARKVNHRLAAAQRLKHAFNTPTKAPVATPVRTLEETESEKVL